MTGYTRAQVDRFSPRSKAILEIQSARDLEILERIYANSVLLGDDGPDGWGIRYSTEFHMTNDSELFPPRPKWEADGYRPDEYSRWLKSDWRPIAELWAELRIDPSRIVPIDPECERRRTGLDAQRTEWKIRCAQPPYDRLPIPRADIPAGIILSREADAWVREDKIETVALPLYEGRMIGLYDFCQKGWVSGKGRKAEWREIDWFEKQLEPQFLMRLSDYVGETDRDGNPKAIRGLKCGFMAVGSATNARSMTAGPINDCPCGNAIPSLSSSIANGVPTLVAILDSVAYDYALRSRLAGLNLNYFVVAETPLPTPDQVKALRIFANAAALTVSNVMFAENWLAVELQTGSWRQNWAVSPRARMRGIAANEAVMKAIFRLSWTDALHVLEGCDLPRNALDSAGIRKLNPKGF